jgi:hypothetical protein
VNVGMNQQNLSFGTLNIHLSSARIENKSGIPKFLSRFVTGIERGIIVSSIENHFNAVKSPYVVKSSMNSLHYDTVSFSPQSSIEKKEIVKSIAGSKPSQPLNISVKLKSSAEEYRLKNAIEMFLAVFGLKGKGNGAYLEVK